MYSHSWVRAVYEEKRNLVCARIAHMPSVQGTSVFPVNVKYFVCGYVPPFLGPAFCRYMYMYRMHFFLSRAPLSGIRGSFSHFRLRGKQGGRGYITMHVWILAEHRGSARGMERHWIGSKKTRECFPPRRDEYLVGDMRNPTFFVFVFRI